MNKVCEQCGVTFMAKSAKGRYCSGTCRVAAYRKGVTSEGIPITIDNVHAVADAMKAAKDAGGDKDAILNATGAVVRGSIEDQRGTPAQQKWMEDPRRRGFKRTEVAWENYGLSRHQIGGPRGMWLRRPCEPYPIKGTDTCFHGDRPFAECDIGVCRVALAKGFTDEEYNF